MTKIYVKRDSYIYEVNYERQCDSEEYAQVYRLDLLCGMDYVNPDFSNRQGWVSKDHFIEEIQLEHIVAYPLSETLTESLKQNDYMILEDRPLYISGEERED